jgi:hypothetical protein
MDVCDYSKLQGNVRLEAGTDPAHQSVVIPDATGAGCATRFEVHDSPTDIASGGAGFRSMWAKYDSNEGTTGGAEFVYGFSVRVGSTIPKYVHIWELHQRANIYRVDPDLSIAPHAVMFRNGQMQYREMTGAGVWNGSAWTRYQNYNDQQVLVASPKPDTWYDVMIHIKASEGSTGLTEAFVREAGQSWPTVPQYVNNGPSLPYVPGGLDPGIPSKISTYDDVSGLSGLYLEAGLYTGDNTWYEPTNSIVTVMDNLRRYTSLEAARSGFGK